MWTSVKFVAGAVSAIIFVPTIALAQPNPQPANSSPQELNLPASPPAGSFPRVQPASGAVSQSPTETPLSCPPGQFPSKFPDITPDHWAYEAVNRLAIGEFRCFN